MDAFPPRPNPALTSASRPPRPDDPQFLPVKALAARWAMAQSTVYELLARGELPWTKLGGRIRVKRADVEAYEAAGTQPAVRRPTRLRVLPRRGPASGEQKDTRWQSETRPEQ